MTQTGIFGFQESNPVNVTGQTIIEILQLNFLSNATMARWTATYNNRWVNTIANIEIHNKTKQNKNESC